MAQGVTKPRAIGTRVPPPPLKAEAIVVRKDIAVPFVNKSAVMDDPVPTRET